MVVTAKQMVIFSIVGFVLLVLLVVSRILEPTQGERNMQQLVEKSIQECMSYGATREACTFKPHTVTWIDSVTFKDEAGVIHHVAPTTH